ncbi:MAG: DUF6044 family protein [Candidatus Cloacimonetes bacterium]|nr:DUF6044 family protein [Candidatus Cloacimonadota bacterium]
MSKGKKDEIKPQEDFTLSTFYQKLDDSRIVLIIISLFFLIYFLPYFVKGEDSYIPQFDNLDQISYLGHFNGHFQGHFFPSDNIEEYYLPGMEPVFRLAVLSFQKIFWLLGFFWGYVINEILFRLLAFAGFYLLLKRWLTPELPRLLPALLALAYVFIPFWSQGGLSVAGLPLLAWILLNLQNKEKILLSYLLLLLYITYSSLFLTGIFVIAILGTLIFFRLLFRKNCLRLIPPLLIMIVVYTLTNYPYFLINFVYKIPTNRGEIQLLSLNFRDAFQNSFLKFFITTHVHAHSFQQYLLLPATILTAIVLAKNRNYKLRNVALSLTAFLLGSAILFALYRFKPINDWYTKLGFGFDYSRLYFLNPPVWYIIPALGIAYGYQHLKNKKVYLIIIILLLLVQIGINYRYSSLGTWTKRPTFRQVMSHDQFAEIEKQLTSKVPGFNKAETRIGCVGFQPAVANFNGFKTFGAYCPIYPLHLKDEFLEILAGEMAKNRKLDIYMHKWGSQLYLFDDVIFINMLDQKYLQQRVRTITCDLNTAKLKEMGVDYLFTAAEYDNAPAKGLKEICRDTDPVHYYRIYVYAIESEKSGDVRSETKERRSD